MWNIAPAFAELTAYNAGTQVEQLGIVFQATSAIPVTNTTTPIQDGGVNWKVISVIRVTEAYSLWNSVAIALNEPTNETIMGSIWMFIQVAQNRLDKVLRSPAQKITRSFVIDDNSSFTFPDDLLEIDTLRIQGDLGFSTRLLEDQGYIEIIGGNKQQFEFLRQNYNNGGYSGYSNTETDFPLYWVDDNVCRIAPAFDAGTVIELTYYKAEAHLMTTQFEVNASYEPINVDRQTLVQWIAAGNLESSFVQSQVQITENIWTVQCPHLLKLGACIAAEHYLNNPLRVAEWEKEFVLNLTETKEEYSRFNNNRVRALTLKSPNAF